MLGSFMLAGAIAAAACSGGEAAPSTPPAGGGRGDGPNAQVVPVTAATVVQKSVPLAVQGIGTVIAASTVTVRAQVTGELTSVNFIEGDEVKEGQVLVTIDKRPLEAALQQAQAALDRDVAQAANARSQAVRYQDLLQRGIATKEQVDQIVANAAALDATVALDRANIESARVQLQYATIRAPLAGKTGLLQVHAGNLVRATDTTPIVTINKITPVYVSFSVPEAMLPELKRYMAKRKLAVTALAPNDSGPPATGVINFIDNAVDPTTGQIKVKGTFPNTDRRLWPGQYVNVSVTLSTEPNAIVAPSLAVQTGQQGPYVFVIKPDQTVDLRSVVVERTSGDQSVIKSGLAPGETVVTDGQLRLNPGTKVSIKNGQPAKVTS
ncbi:MAG: efflux RND transporter periplasmic adaptor subunit [Vicinamibacterales bacterium]